jgi:hypothetical protein
VPICSRARSSRIRDWRHIATRYDRCANPPSRPSVLQPSSRSGFCQLVAGQLTVGADVSFSARSLPRVETIDAR